MILLRLANDDDDDDDDDVNAKIFISELRRRMFKFYPTILVVSNSFVLSFKKIKIVARFCFHAIL